MISALTELDSIVRCIEAGADDYLAKPFDPSCCARAWVRAWKKKRLRDQLKVSLERLEQELAPRPARFKLACYLARFRDDSGAAGSTFMEPAREVGGDLYDCFYAAEGAFCFLVGDVSGKGAAAAMFMARTSSLMRMASRALATNAVR